MMATGMLCRTQSVLVALCLLSLTAGVHAGSGHDTRMTTVPPVAGAPVTFSSTIRGLEQARPRTDGALVTNGRVSGTGAVDADHVIIEDVLAPGNSPGCISFGGNVTFSFTATLIMEIEGNMPCSGHDQTSVAGTLTINNATLQIVLLNGYLPQFGERFDILDWGSLTGSFGNIDTSNAPLPHPLAWDSSQLHLSGELVVGVQQFADGDLAPWGSPDGLTNAADVLIATRLALGQLAPGPLQYAHGDMNSDGNIDLADLLLIQRTALGL